MKKRRWEKGKIDGKYNWIGGREKEKKQWFYRGYVGKLPSIPMVIVTLNCEQMQITQLVEFYSKNPKVVPFAMPVDRCSGGFCSIEVFARVNQGSDDPTPLDGVC